MAELIINKPVSELQKIIKLGPGGKYFDTSRIVWDDSVHGPLTDELRAQVGGLSRSGDTVTFDQTAKDANDLKISNLIQAEVDEKAEQINRTARLRGAGSANSISELRSLVQDIVKELGI